MTDPIQASNAQPLMALKTELSNEAFARLLLERGPVFWSEADQFWVVSHHAPALMVLRSPDFSADRSSFFMSRMSRCPFHKVANFFGVVKKMMVTSDPPHHTARRSLAAAGMNDELMEEFAPAVERVVGELLQECLARPDFDFVGDLALHLPNIVLADLFSIPAERRPDFYRWANHMTQFFGGAGADIEVDAENADTGAHELKRYFTELIKERRRNPGSDFISRLLLKQGELGLDDDEVISQAAILLVAGTITTTDQLANIMNLLLEHPENLQAVRKDLSRLDRITEEACRLDPAVSFVFRVAKKNMTLAGVEIKEGQLVFVSTTAANRDPAVFSEPHQFQMERTKNPHLSFGQGIHYCLGAKLGRIQIKALFRALFESTGELTALEQPVRKNESLAFSGYQSLRLKNHVASQKVGASL